MYFLPPLGVAASCTLIVAAAASWFGLVTHGEGIAFADVKEQLEKMRTVRYVVTELAESAAPDVPGAAVAAPSP